MDSVITTIILFILSIIITVLITKYYSFRSKLNIILTSIIDLVKISVLARGKVKILYNNEEVKSLSVIRIVIENQGNTDLSEEQVKIAPSIKFMPKIKVISIDDVSKTDKSNVLTDIISENEIKFHLKF